LLCNRPIIITDALVLAIVTLIFPYLITSAVPVINSVSSAAFASTIAVPSEQQDPLNLSNNDGDSITPVMAASGNNIVYVAWVDDTPGYEAVFLAKSLDGGTNFSIVTSLGVLLYQ
jgi:hypothetical protein